MRQTHLAGDKLFVDDAGQTMPVIDRMTGEVRQAEIFVAVLGALELYVCGGDVDAKSAGSRRRRPHPRIQLLWRCAQHRGAG